MPIKKILIFVIFGGVVFAGSVATMLVIGKYLKDSEVAENVIDEEKTLSSEERQEAVRESNINKIIDKIYNKQTGGFKDYNAQFDEPDTLLNNIKPAKLIDEIKRLKETYEAKHMELKGEESKLVKLKGELVIERKRMDLLKKGMEKDLEMINEARKAIQDNMVTMDAEETSNMKLLANIYEGMKSKQAASIISRMDQRTAVKLLKLMDRRNSAKILQDVDPATAVKITEQIRGFSSNN
ncbi:MAG: MotE family protein [Candidatus Anammoxibacter sp.]